MFPSINHINDLLPFIEGNKQFRVDVQDNGFTVVCYMVKDEDTFKGEHAFWYQECRGITFDVAGRVASRTLHKFPNVGENDECQPHQIPWHRIVRVMDKRDGSMITPVLMPDGSIRCKTKKTFTSAEAIEATNLLNADPMKVEWVRALLQHGITPTFEWTSPRFPIVLLYEQDELTLLQVRNNITGEYIVDLEGTFPNCPFPIVENMLGLFSREKVTDEGVTNIVDWEQLKAAAETREGIEGWILQADDGQMWKVKTKWYCELHHSVTFTRYRDVARTVLEDKSDDLKAAFALTGRDIAPIVEIERVIFDKIKAYEDEVQNVVMYQDALMTAKDMALKYKDHELFGQIMSTFRGKSVDWLKFYLVNHIRDHSLEVIPQAGMDDIVEDEAPA
jgi:T4 RnlA family RNA ligase